MSADRLVAEAQRIAALAWNECVERDVADPPDDDVIIEVLTAHILSALQQAQAQANVALNAQIEESRRLLRDRDAFWKSRDDALDALEQAQARPEIEPKICACGDHLIEHTLISECPTCSMRQFGPPPRERGEWAPIETAPKDADILLLCPTHGVVRGRWKDDKYAKKPRPYWTNDRERLWGVGSTRADQPTHWMPLPAPPAPPAEGSAETHHPRCHAGMCYSDGSRIFPVHPCECETLRARSDADTEKP